MQGLLLGLTNGTACLASCAPVILPYLLGEAKSVRTNILNLVLFSTGRLIGYGFFGVLAWIASQALFNNFSIRAEFLCTSYILLGFLMLQYNLSGRKKTCNLKMADKALEKYFDKSAALYPIIFGFITGINICPPFLLVFTEATASGSLVKSVLFFIMFFLGTSVYFIPFPFLGLLKKIPELKTVGELAVYIVAAYYILKGIFMIGGLLV